MSPDYGDAVDGVGVAAALAGERGTLDGCAVVGALARVPHADLARVGTAQEEIRVIGTEARAEDVGGRGEGVFGS